MTNNCACTRIIRQKTRVLVNTSCLGNVQSWVSPGRQLTKISKKKTWKELILKVR
jgi:hypothetical protein